MPAEKLFSVRVHLLTAACNNVFVEQRIVTACFVSCGVACIDLCPLCVTVKPRVSFLLSDVVAVGVHVSV